jgi:heat shock protein HslJ
MAGNMRELHTWAALLGAALLMMMSPGDASLAQSGANQLAGSEWRPVEIRGEPVNANGIAFVRFGAEGKVSGSGGCNRFFGQYDTEGTKLALSRLGSTRKACAPSLMDLERSFLGTLQETAVLERRGANLELRDASGRTIMRLAQTDWD